MSGLSTAGLLAPKKTVLYCSFCGKSQHEVEVLIKGPTVQICDECVALCTTIVAVKRASQNVVSSR